VSDPHIEDSADVALANAQSVYREKILEHGFITNLMLCDWRSKCANIDILRPEIDRFGYDLVASRGAITRFIQVKSSVVRGPTRVQKVHVNLLSKPDGCVVWIIVNERLDVDSYLVRIPPVGQSLGCDGLKVAKHTKANAEGVKAERPNIRVMPISAFTPKQSIDDVFSDLFPG